MKLNRATDYKKYQSYKPSLSFHIDGDNVMTELVKTTELATKSITLPTTRTAKLTTYKVYTETTDDIKNSHDTERYKMYLVLATLVTLCFII